jgi:hypothetical protein
LFGEIQREKLSRHSNTGDKNPALRHHTTRPQWTSRINRDHLPQSVINMRGCQQSDVRMHMGYAVPIRNERIADGADLQDKNITPKIITRIFP